VGVHWRSETLFHEDELLKHVRMATALMTFALAFMCHEQEGRETRAESSVRVLSFRNREVFMQKSFLTS
jgi:hypothetical protein